MNFKKVNVKNSKMEFKKQLKYGFSSQWDAYNKLTQRDNYNRGFVKKNQVKLKNLSPVFNLERELCNTSVLSYHTWIKT